MKKWRTNGRGLLQQFQVAALAASRPSRILDVLEELAKVLSLGSFHGAETDANSCGRGTASYDSAQGKAFDPDFSVGDPEPNLDFGSALNGTCCFHQAAPHTGVVQVSPNRRFSIVHPQFHRNIASNTWMSSAVVGQVRGEKTC